VCQREPRRAELAAVVRACAPAYRQRHGLSPGEERVLRAIAACRTEAMGGHVCACDTCGAQQYHYHSCRNRHCPKCQTRAKEQWLQRQRAQLLPVPYFHVVFTLPHELNALIRLDARALYDLLFDTAAQTLQEFANNPRWLGGTLGFTLVLHTWSQTLMHHPHVHGLVSGGALASDGHWRPAKPGFLFPVQALSRVFRGKYLDALNALRKQNVLRLPDTLTEHARWTALISALRQQPWVVYLKPPMSGPEQVLEYLARYTHRVALSNDRLVSATAEEVCLHYRDRAHGNARRLMRLPSQEFLRRFLLHVLPAGFKRIRHYGLTANRSKAVQLAACRAVLHAPTPVPPQVESAEAFLIRLIGRDVRRCPHCAQGRLVIVQQLPRPMHLPDLRATGPPAPS
jgi:Putative transposase/Transposase zinc-binding domain